MIPTRTIRFYEDRGLITPRRDDQRRAALSQQQRDIASMLRELADLERHCSGLLEAKEVAPKVGAGGEDMTELERQAEKVRGALARAVAEALDRKRRLGQYAVVYENGRPVRIEPAPEPAPVERRR